MAINKEAEIKAKRQKKSALEVVANEFFAETAKHVGEFMYKDVIIPGVKGIIADLAAKGINMLLYGDSSSYSGKSSTASTYHSAYNKSNTTTQSNRYVNTYAYDNLIVNSRQEGERILAKMGDVLKDVGYVTVADMYDLVGETHQWTDNKYGWTDLRGASVTLARDGYLIKMPEVKPL